MSILGVLGIVFIVLKLLGIIAWSWWLVLLPFIISTALLVVFFIAALIIGTWR
jgi:hypothetical protein